MKNFKDLVVWQKSMDLVTSVYRATKTFPTEEKYGLANQMRRAAVSIPSNIAEGNMRTTDKDFRQFISIARGSCSELETQTIIAARLDYLRDDEQKELLKITEEVAKMLGSLFAKLRS